MANNTTNNNSDPSWNSSTTAWVVAAVVVLGVGILAYSLTETRNDDSAIGGPYQPLNQTDTTGTTNTPTYDGTAPHAAPGTDNTGMGTGAGTTGGTTNNGM